MAYAKLLSQAFVWQRPERPSPPRSEPEDGDRNGGTPVPAA